MLRSTRIVVLLGIAVQIAAFLRTALIAATLGTSPEVDAYNLGLIAPIFLTTAASAWLQMTFIGRYAGLVSTGETALAAAYRGGMLFLLIGLSLLLTTVCFLFADRLMLLLLPADATSLTASASTALAISALILVPTLVGDFLALVLNGHGRFMFAALAPLINALVSVLALWFWPRLDLSALIWTLVLGYIAQGIVVVAGIARLRLDFPLRIGAARAEILATIALAAPLLPTMILSSLTGPIIQLQAAQLGEGLVAAYGYAFRLHSALSQTIVVALSTVLLPHLAALWSRGQTAEIAVLFRRLARLTVPIAAYLCVGIFLMGETTTKILFQRGAFVATNTEQVSWLWVLLSLALFPAAFGTFVSKLGQALRRTGSMLATAVILFGVTWSVAHLGVFAASIDIVVCASGAAYLATLCYWLIWLNRHIDGKPVLADMASALLRTAIILIPAALAERFVHTFTAGLPDLGGLMLRAAAFSAAALVVLIATRSHRWFTDRHLEVPSRQSAA